jgi:hypothetical protein
MVQTQSQKDSMVIGYCYIMALFCEPVAQLLLVESNAE